MTTLENLTVIIPTFNRADYLLRQLIYWKGSEVQLIVIDGSDEQMSELSINYFSRLVKLTYVYDTSDLCTRLNKAAKLIQTEYAVLSADDSFLLRHGLLSAIQCLQNDESLSACMGQAISFGYSEKMQDVQFGRGYSKQAMGICCATSFERINRAFSDYHAITSYSVQRAGVWKKSWGEAPSFSSPYVPEINQAIVTYMYGGVALINAPLWVASKENKYVETKDWDRSISFEEWWISPIFYFERKVFTNKLLDVYRQVNGENNTGLLELLIKVMETHVQRQLGGGILGAGLTILKIKFIVKWVMRKQCPSFLIYLQSLKALEHEYKEIYEYGQLDEIFHAKSNWSWGNTDPVKSDFALVCGLVRDFHKGKGAL